MTERVAVVVVTYNRADLLEGMLAGLAAQTRRPDLVLVVDNASTDHTRAVLAGHHHDLPLEAVHLGENTGGAGGFHHGLRAAHERGFDWLWLMDDDVVPARECLEVLITQGEDCVMPVREDLDGGLVEKAAIRFDLRNPFAVHPKTATVDTTYENRADMPERVLLENVAFEGLLIRRAVVDAVGLPDPSFFIFYDDVDFAIRARRAGYRIWGVRDAVLVRQLRFDQQHALDTWKGYYMYRNLFAVHFRYGENPLVRAKPYAIAVAVTLLSPARGGRGEARNVLRAVRDARGMRGGAVGGGGHVGARTGYASRMSNDGADARGRVDDEAEEQERSSTTQGAAARGEYDPADGSPGGSHPTGEDFPDEAVRYDEPDERPRTATQE